MLRLLYIFLFSGVILFLTGCGAPGVDAYHRGNQAYEYGDYKTSFVNYLYAANQDVTPAEYAVAYQYFYGQGTKRDQMEAIKWLQKAAPHSPRAQYALSLIQGETPLQPWTYRLGNK
ncbi:MAG: hypothetical protein NTU49_01030 [Gammaproteobacteria bacterium]|nr:hypothetical protein [Gammaproteobacteria bacterium]